MFLRRESIRQKRRPVGDHCRAFRQIVHTISPGRHAAVGSRSNAFVGLASRKPKIRLKTPDSVSIWVWSSRTHGGARVHGP